MLNINHSKQQVKENTENHYKIFWMKQRNMLSICVDIWGGIASSDQFGYWDLLTLKCHFLQFPNSFLRAMLEIRKHS